MKNCDEMVSSLLERRERYVCEQKKEKKNRLRHCGILMLRMPYSAVCGRRTEQRYFHFSDIARKNVRRCRLSRH